MKFFKDTLIFPDYVFLEKYLKKQEQIDSEADK